MEKGEKIHGEFGVHTILDEEEIAFADWINHALQGDCDVAHKLPLACNGSDMYAKADDGVMLCKMINLACPNTVDCRVINTGKNISIFKVIFYPNHIYITRIIIFLVAATRELETGYQIIEGHRLCGGGDRPP